jgi:hypothetical protein
MARLEYAREGAGAEFKAQRGQAAAEAMSEPSKLHERLPVLLESELGFDQTEDTWVIPLSALLNTGLGLGCCCPSVASA